jgi:hypothetical protein
VMTASLRTRIVQRELSEKCQTAANAASAIAASK